MCYHDPVIPNTHMSRRTRALPLLSAFAIVAILAAAVGPLQSLRLTANLSDAWGVEGWTYRKEITISNTDVDEDLTDFPLLVKFTADTDIGAHALASGYDIRFTDADGNAIPYERESFSIKAGSGSGIFWVKVPTITTAADSTIYAYYGKSDASDGQSATSVWDANFKGVWHLPNGATLSANDSTSNANNGTNNGATATTGKVDGAGNFDGTDIITTANV